MSPNESALLKGSWAGIEDMVYCREIRTAEATFRVSAVFPATKIEGLASVSEAALRTKDS